MSGSTMQEEKKPANNHRRLLQKNRFQDEKLKQSKISINNLGTCFKQEGYLFLQNSLARLCSYQDVDNDLI